jgi:hypothetical protein
MVPMAILALLARCAQAEPLPNVVRLRVGRTAELRLGSPAVRGTCDDPSIVRVEDGGDHLILRGLARGRTQCGFWSNVKLPPRTFDIIVTDG